MRNHFDRQLDKLHIELTTMGGLCEQAIAVVAKAMLDRDVSLLPQAYVIEHKIDRSEREIEGMEPAVIDGLIEICFLLFVNGGFWSVVGMAMSTLMESKYISYATPFVLYYLLVILYERYFSDLFIIYPKTWTDPAAWPFGCWGAAIFLLEMTLIFAILFAFRAGRRLQQL